MKKPDINRFSALPAVAQASSKNYPKGMKPGDDGFLEALLADSGVKFVDKAEKA